mmetsp:Transcript_4863/g.6723  ORF Transcript_4863/g.6723 Transcript_4863/m.6723 type:complete len:137 (+) Transcript_4863:182-592(+)
MNGDDEIGRGSTPHNRLNSSAQAYAPPSMPSNRRTEIFGLILGAIFALFFLRNVLMKDYTQETKSYLTSIGRKDAIDKVVPKTRNQLLDEKMNREILFEQMTRNVSYLMREVKYLRTTIDELKAAKNRDDKPEIKL